jgi:hypothetical protein
MEATGTVAGSLVWTSIMRNDQQVSAISEIPSATMPVHLLQWPEREDHPMGTESNPGFKQQFNDHASSPHIWNFYEVNHLISTFFSFNPETFGLL